MKSDKTVQLKLYSKCSKILNTPSLTKIPMLTVQKHYSLQFHQLLGGKNNMLKCTELENLPT